MGTLHLIRVATVLIFGVTAEIQSQQGTCPVSYLRIADSCFKFVQEQRSYLGAKEFCLDDDASLVAVETPEVYHGLLQHMNNNFPGTYWTSGTYLLGQWKWATTNSVMNPSWWGRSPREQANRCAYFCSITHKYWDAPCDRHKRFICQVEPQPNYQLRPVEIY